MKHRILTAVVVIPLFIVLSTTPAYAIFGSILAGIQRAQMIVNQGIQIYKDTMAKITFDGQLTQMIDQASHLKEQALGAVGALTDPFTELASAPAQFIGVGLSWKSDFTGVAAELADSVEQMGETGKSFTQSWRSRLTAADTVTESDILTLYGDYRPEIAAQAASGYLAAREEGDKRLVLDHAMSDAAANLMIAARDAVESYEGLRNNTNTSNTALAQSQVAGTVTQGNLTAAMAQLMAFQAAKEAAEDYETRDRPAGGAGSMDRDAAPRRDQLRGATGRARCPPRFHARRVALSDSPGLRRERPVIHFADADSTRSQHPDQPFPGTTEGLQVVPRCRSGWTDDGGGRGGFHHRKRALRGAGSHRCGVERAGRSPLAGTFSRGSWCGSSSGCGYRG